MEARARRAYSQGITSERDQFGKLVTNSSEERAKGYLSEADKLRAELNKRIPGADIVSVAQSQLESLKEAVKTLAAIDKSLTVTPTPANGK